MSELIAVRLYFPVAARAKPSSFWHRLSQPSLAGHLLKAAKHSGIEQVVTEMTGQIRLGVFKHEVAKRFGRG